MFLCVGFTTKIDKRSYMAKSKRLLITLSPTALETLQSIADDKGISKSLVLEQYLRGIKRRQKQQKKEIDSES
jgi:hypothetical protein